MKTPSMHSFVSAVLFAAALAVALPSQQSKGRTIALVVGIDHYAQPATGVGVPDLAGCRNDVGLVSEALQTRFGCEAADIETLVDDQATHAAIVRALYELLVERADATTTVVFWFSGHGSLIPDSSGRDDAERFHEQQGAYDSTLLAYDSRSVAAGGSFDIADDELFSLFLASKAKEIVFVSDCCHSGGVLRGGDDRAGVREGERGTEPLDRQRVYALWPDREAAPLRDDDEPFELRGFVHVAACSSIEEAGELTRAGRSHGTLTWYLTRELLRCDAAASWTEVVDGVRANAAGKGTRKNQTVQLDTDYAGAVFGGRARPAPAGFSVLPYGDAAFAVEGGRVHGIGKNATFRLEDYAGKQHGELVASRVRTTSTVAKWAGSKRPLPKIALRAVPVSWGEDAPLLRVAIGDGVPQDLLAPFAFVEVVAASDTPDYVVERRGDALGLRSVDDSYSYAVSADRDELERQLVAELKWRSLWHAPTRPGRYSLSIRMRKPTAAELACENAARRRAAIDKGEQPTTYPPVEQLRAPGRGAPSGYLIGADCWRASSGLAGGRLLALEVENRSKQPVHVVLIAITQTREVSVLDDGRNTLLAPGQTMTKTDVFVARSKSWGEQRGPMIDRYLAIATPRPADFRAFATAEPPSLTRGEQDLPPFLAEALYRTRTRGDGRAAWGVGYCDLHLVSPARFAAAATRLAPAVGR